MDAAFNILIDKFLTTAAKRKASNIHLTVSSYPALRIDDELVELTEEKIITDSFVKTLAKEWLDDYQEKILIDKKSIVITKQIGKKFRIKINFFFQKNFLSASLRIIPSQIPALASLGLHKSIHGLTNKKAGLIIVTGPFGSGRTTTIASMIEEINKTKKKNIITVENPIEYTIGNNKSLVEQREIGRDANSFVDAIKYVYDSDADVVAVGSSQDKAVIPLVLEFANSGRLAIMNMDTTNIVQTIEHIFASFPPEEKQRAELLLSESLLAIIVQRLIPRVGGGLILASEVLMANQPVKSLLKEGRTKQLPTVIQSSRAEGMMTLDQSLVELVRAEEVLTDQAAEYSMDPESFRKQVLM